MKGPARASSRPRVFYGWWIVAACAGIMSYGGGTFFYGFSAFFPPITQEFGWSRAVTSVGFSLQRLEGGIAGVIMGFAFDKIGPRRMVLAGMLVAGGGFIFLSRIENLWSFYLGFLIISLGFSAGFGSMLMATVANWFIRKRARAMGVLMASTGVTAGLYFPLLVWLISAFGWRPAMLLVGVGIWVVCLPMALALRHRPEQYGLLPDGDSPDKPATDSLRQEVRRRTHALSQEAGAAPEVNLTAREALRTPAFWLLSLATALSGMTIAAVMLHIYPFMLDLGIPKGLAAAVIPAMTFISAGARLILGWLGDFYDKRKIIALTWVLQAVGLVILAYAVNGWWLIPWLATYSIGYGGAIPLRPALQADFFGRRAFASIQGLMGVSGVGLGVAAPVLAGWVHDVTGTYYLAFLGLAAATLAAIPIILLAQPPRQPVTRGQAAAPP
ncbi:MAG: MFS transporter [Dehalococcoidia bacterium]|nr:MFS transporter [Dehalococcoidia bacterium]